MESLELICGNDMSDNSDNMSGEETPPSSNNSSSSYDNFPVRTPERMDINRQSFFINNTSRISLDDSLSTFMDEESHNLSDAEDEEEIERTINDTVSRIRDMRERMSSIGRMNERESILRNSTNLEDEFGTATELSYEAMVRLTERLGDVRQERWESVSMREIRKLPIITYNDLLLNKAKAGDDSLSQCLICQCSYVEGESLRKLPCNHYFHTECVYQWLHSKDIRPYCQQSTL